MSPYTPVPRVQFAFGVGPLDDPSADWVTLDDDGITIESIDIDRGRDSEFDDFPASTCKMTITDANRVLDPSNASGPYSGDLKPRVWVRAQGYINPTAYDRFTGFVDGWPVRNGRGVTTVNLTATDAQKILASKRLPQSVYETVVLADGPVAFWPFGETGEVAADISGNRYDGTYTSNTIRAQPSVVPASAGSSIGLTALDYQGVLAPEAARLELPCAIEMWVQADAPESTTQRYLAWQYGGTTGLGFALLVGNDSPTDRFLIAYVIDSGGSDYIRSWAIDIYDGQPHHLVFSLGTTDATLSFDGVSATNRDFGTGNTPRAATGGPMIGSYPYASFVAIDGLIDDVSLWDAAMSQTDARAHYVAGTTPWDGDTTGGRIERILDLIGWPAGMRSIDDGEMILGPANLAGRGALDYVKACAASEQGRLFIDGSGNITFHQRDRFLTEATESTSQLTFSDDGAGDSIYAGLSFTLDEQKVVNGVDVTREGGLPQHAEDAASQSAYGPAERSISGVLLAHDRNSRQIAEYIVARYAEPQERAEGWSIQPELDSSSWADIFGLEIGHRVTLECTPANVGSQKVMEQHLERIADTITPESWTVEFNGSSVDEAAYLFWGSGLWGTGVWR